MHVAINGWFWDQPMTGSCTYVRGLVKALRSVDKDMQLTLILPPRITEPEAVPDGVTVHHTGGGLPGKLGKVWFEQQQFPDAVADCGADIAHVPYWGTPFRSPARLVTSVLDVIPLIYPEYAGGVATRFYTSMVRAAAQGSAAIITLSEAAKADVTEQLDVPAERVTPIHLAPGLDFHPQLGSERDPDVAEKYNLPEDPFILYLGGFDVRKRVKQLLAAYTYIVRAHGEQTPLVLAGKTPDEWREPLFPDLDAFIREQDIPEENIHWIGYVDEDDKPSLYRLAKVFVYPSAYEGFGLPVLEAMASGTPTVANELPVFQEIVGDGAFLVEDGSATRMAGAIMALLEQQDLYDSLQNNGTARATNFNWRNTARETLDVYKQILR